MLGAVEEQSYGILSIVPRDAEGREISQQELENHIIHVDGQELKAWASLAKYLESFPKTEGKSEIPDYYHTTHNRKIIDNDNSALAVFVNPNQIARTIFSIVSILLVILILLAALVIVKIKKRRH